MVYYCNKNIKCKRDFGIGQRAEDGKILRSIIQKRREYLQKTVSRSMDINVFTSEDSKGSEGYSRENIYHLREYLNHCKWTIRNIDVKYATCERNEVHVTANWKKGNLCYIIITKLTELHFIVMWKAEFVSDKLGYLDEISK